MKRKVLAICTHNGNCMLNLTFITKDGEPHTMYDLSEDILAGEFRSFTAMYTSILRRAKWNGYYIPYHKEFGAKWYNILFIDSKNPTEMNRYAYQGMEENDNV